MLSAFLLPYERFMVEESKDGGELKRVARAIDKELKKSGAPNVYLDCTHLDFNAFKYCLNVCFIEANSLKDSSVKPNNCCW